MKKKIKIGFLIDSYKLPLWKYTIIEKLENCHYASVELVIINDKQDIKNSFLNKVRSSWKYTVYNLYQKIDEWLFNIKKNAFETKNSIGFLCEMPTIKIKPISNGCLDSFKNEDVLEINSYHLDVLIKFGFDTLDGEILESAKYGVWSYHHDGNNISCGGFLGFFEVMENSEVTESILKILNKEQDEEKVIYQSFSQTDKRSIYRNRNNVYWKSLSFLPRKLEELYNIGDVSFFNKINNEHKKINFDSSKLHSHEDLYNLNIIKLVVGLYSRFFVSKFIHFIYFEQWILLFNTSNKISTSLLSFTKIIPSKKRLFADPFIVAEEDKYYIFIEECPYGSSKAHLSVMVMDENGCYGEPVTIIDKPYHLSYPFVFKQDGGYFLVPESRSNKTIELYKCVDFPYKWEFQMNLMENIEAVDSTFFYYKDKWWLFTNIVENAGASSYDELFLFFSEEICTSDWTPHPLNPIVSDVRKSRPAGNIFRHDGRIMRPSQNCSKRYGYGFKINEIVTLNENEYEEVEVDSIEPNWDKKIVATHTFNHVNNLTVIDGIYKRRRYF
jgi:hypothetical protein